MNGELEEENLNKSEISQVFEIALKRNLPVIFEVSAAFLLINTKLCLQGLNSFMPLALGLFFLSSCISKKTKNNVWLCP